MKDECVYVIIVRYPDGSEVDMNTPLDYDEAIKTQEVLYRHGTKGFEFPIYVRTTTYEVAS